MPAREEHASSQAIAPGLDLTVDYGWLTVIAVPLFWVLEWLHQWVGNWGVAIILLTVIIKLAVLPAVGGELPLDGEDAGGGAEDAAASRISTATTASACSRR